MKHMDISIVRNLASTIMTRYGANASAVAQHAARQAHSDGDLDGAKQWSRVHQSIESLSGAGSTGNKVDISV
jgi:hypothetical protein